MQFGKLHGVALVVLGAILLGLQALLFIAPREVVSRPAESSMPNAAHKTNLVSGILGVASLIAGVAIFATRRRADEPEAKNAVK